MNRRIAAATVIHGEGECQAFVNGVADQDIKRKQEKMRAEMQRALAVEGSRNRLLARNLAEIEGMINPKPNLFQRLWRPVADAWALFWAVWFNFDEIFINWCLEKGFIEEVE